MRCAASSISIYCFFNLFATLSRRYWDCNSWSVNGECLLNNKRKFVNVNIFQMLCESRAGSPSIVELSLIVCFIARDASRCARWLRTKLIGKFFVEIYLGTTPEDNRFGAAVQLVSYRLHKYAAEILTSIYHLKFFPPFVQFLRSLPAILVIKSLINLRLSCPCGLRSQNEFNGYIPSEIFSLNSLRSEKQQFPRQKHKIVSTVVTGKPWRKKNVSASELKMESILMVSECVDIFFRGSLTHMHGPQTISARRFSIESYGTRLTLFDNTINAEHDAVTLKSNSDALKFLSKAKFQWALFSVQRGWEGLFSSVGCELKINEARWVKWRQNEAGFVGRIQGKEFKKIQVEVNGRRT